jgi:hypothetical protein
VRWNRVPGDPDRDERISSNPEVAALGLDLVIQHKLPLALVLVLLFVRLRARVRRLAPET